MNALLSHLCRSAPAHFNPGLLSGAASSAGAAPPVAVPTSALQPAAPADVARPAPLPDAAPLTGPVCGWFDSSWDLQQGLRVSEWPDSDGPVAALWFATLAAAAGSAGLQ